MATRASGGVERRLRRTGREEAKGKGPRESETQAVGDCCWRQDQKHCNLHLPKLDTRKGAGTACEDLALARKGLLRRPGDVHLAFQKEEAPQTSQPEASGPRISWSHATGIQTTATKQAPKSRSKTSGSQEREFSRTRIGEELGFLRMYCTKQRVLERHGCSRKKAKEAQEDGRCGEKPDLQGTLSQDALKTNATSTQKRYQIHPEDTSESAPK